GRRHVRQAPAPRRRLRSRRHRRARAALPAAGGQAARRPVGVPGRQGGAGRDAGSLPDPRAERGTGHHRRPGLPRALRVRQPLVRELPPVDAALSVPTVGGAGDPPRACGAGLGEAQPDGRLSDAAGRRAAGRLVAGPALTGWLGAFRRAEALPEGFERQVEVLHRPLADSIAEAARVAGRCVVVGVCGSQASGKSTLCAVVAHLLAEAGLKAAVLSIDDLYLTHQERAALAGAVHPLLATRGVP